MNRTVPVTMPDWMWGRLATIAEHRRTDVAGLVSTALVGIVDTDPDRLGQLRAEEHAARTSGYRAPRGSLAASPADAKIRAERELALIRQLRDEGLSDSEIAARMGMSRYQVQGRRARAGIPPHRKESNA